MTPTIYTYQGSSITFQRGDSVMVNATEMAKPFGKLTKDWLSNKQTEELIASLSSKRGIPPFELCKVVKGAPSTGGGTWLHEDLALIFAQWLSPQFYLWCNDRIKELLQTGVTTTANDDEAILHAMQVLQKRVEENKQRIQILEGENSIQQEQIKSLTPRAEYTDEVLQSTSTITTNQIAQELGMSAIALNKRLKELKIQYKQGKQWLICSKYRDMGIASTRTYSYIDSATGEKKTSILTVWTEKGRMLIHEKLQKS